jgi:hypothetical protein
MVRGLLPRSLEALLGGEAVSKKTIPEIWTERLLATTQSPLFWNAQMKERGWDAAQIPVPPWHKRLRTAIRLATEETREVIAYKIAPWLPTDDDLNY